MFVLKAGNLSCNICCAGSFEWQTYQFSLVTDYKVHLACSRCVYQMLLSGNSCFLKVHRIKWRVAWMNTELRQGQNPLPPLLSVPPSIHTPVLLFQIHSAPLSSACLNCAWTHQNKKGSDVSQHSPFSYSFITNQNPPFCQVQATNSLAAISQTLQCTAQRFMQRECTLLLLSLQECYGDKLREQDSGTHERV